MLALTHHDAPLIRVSASSITGGLGRVARLAVCVLMSGALALFGWSSGGAGHGNVDGNSVHQIVELTNAVRAQHALPPLSVNPRLTRAAEGYARTLARSGWFDHVGPEGSTLETRAHVVEYAGWTFLGENLAMGTGALRAEDAIEGWTRSPAHRRNLLSPDLEEIGVGCYVSPGEPSRYWCVQEFGTRSSAALAAERFR